MEIISSLQRIYLQAPSNKVSEETQLSGMIKEMNQEESMKLSLKNMGWSCVLESNQLGYSFNFCSIPKLYLFQ